MHLEPTPPEVLINEPGGQHGRENQARANTAGRAIHFPDGNATIAPLLVRSLVPKAIPGSTQEDIVTACIVGRKQFGRISIADADAAGSSHTDAAIDMAYRAGGEVIESRARAYLSTLTRSNQ